jgi:phenylpropionate dioxygenase-like ring-hydroxylating dioxygenase large terminal subunit
MYLAHRNDLENGEAKPLEQTLNKKFIINDNGKYRIGNNICPHQLSRIIGKKTSELRCQYHGWSWDTQGKPKDSGASCVVNNSSIFFDDNVFETNGLLFDRKIDLSTVPHVSVDNLILAQHRVDTVDADPRITMDIFLDVDHIPYVHEGVYNLLGIEGPANVDWDYFDWGSIQKVSDSEGNQIATWIAVYPYTMIEWQAGSVFITECFDENKIAVWKYYNKDTSYKSFEENSVMWETAFSQDKGQAVQMVRFPNNANLEEAKKHYRTWLENHK